MLREEVIRRLADAPTYSLGCRFFQNGDVFQLQSRDNECFARVGRGGPSVRLQMEGGELQAYSCTCAAFAQSGGSACCHVVAVAKAWQQHFFAAAGQGEEREEDGALRALVEAFADKSASAPVELLPTCYIRGEQSLFVELSFTIGTTRQYAVQDIKELAEGLVLGRKVYFDEHFTLDCRSQRFTPRARALCDLLAALYKDALRMPSVHTPFESLCSETLIRLSSAAARRFFEIAEGAPFDLYAGRAFRPRSVVLRQRPPLQLHLRDVGRMETALYLGEKQVKALTEECDYVLFGGDQIYRVDETCAWSLKRMLGALQESAMPGIEISSWRMPQFLRCVLPQLEAVASVEGADALRKRFWIADLDGAQVHFSGSGRGIAARVSFCYGARKVDPLQPVAQDAKRVLVRDEKSEQPLLWLLESFGFVARAGAYVLDEEEAVFRFLQSGMARLRALAEVSYATGLEALGVRRIEWIAARLAVRQEAMLEVTVCWNDLEQETLLRVLAAQRRKERYYRLPDGAFLSLEDGSAAAAADFAEQSGLLAQARAPLSLLKAPYLRALAREGGAVDLECEPALQTLLAELEAPERADIPLPPALEDVLRKYQAAGYRWLRTLAAHRLGGVLADDMGLGKTLQAIALLLSVSAPKEQSRRSQSLVVVPTSLLYNWQAELARFAPQLEVLAIAGSQAQRRILLEDRADFCDVLLTTYGLLRKDIALYENRRFRCCFLDEAQQIKNPAADSAKAVKRIAAQARFALSGTPLENNLTELWSIFEFVLPGYLLPKIAFRRQFELAAGDPKEAAALAELRRFVQPYILRRLKKEVLGELPPKIETRLFAEMTARQKSVYQAHFLRAKEECAGEVAARGFAQSRMKILAWLTRLRQICCHPALFQEAYQGGSGKQELLLFVAGEAVAAGHRVLVFSQFTSMLRLLRDAFAKKGYESFYLDGKVPAHKRMEMVEAFNWGKCPLFLISLKAGGTGLNLTGADVVIHYEPWWNPAAEAQASDRVYRIGQRRAVQVIRLVARGTIEEQIFALQARKRALACKVVEPGAADAAGLDEAELRALLDL